MSNTSQGTTPSTSVDHAVDTLRQAFQLDTGGAVALKHHDATVDQSFVSTLWSDLTPFAQGYIEAMLQGRVYHARDCHQQVAQTELGCTCPDRWRFSDLAPETLARTIADCEALDFVIIGCVMGGDVARGRVAWEWRQNATADPRSPAQRDHDRFPPLTPELRNGKVYLAEAGQ